MKLFCCYTTAHEVLLRDYFQPSLPEGFELRTYFFEAEGRGDFLSTEYMACLRFKVERILETLREYPGEILVWSDIDLVFGDTSAKGLEEIFRDSGRQILYQRESRHGTEVNGGFFICRAGPELVTFFNRVLRRMESDATVHDQHVANELLPQSPGEFWGFLPLRFHARSHGWPPPRDLALYHANCTTGRDSLGQKIRQLEELKWIRRRRRWALLWPGSPRVLEKVCRIIGDRVRPRA